MKIYISVLKSNMRSPADGNYRYFKFLYTGKQRNLFKIVFLSLILEKCLVTHKIWRRIGIYPAYIVSISSFTFYEATTDKKHARIRFLLANYRSKINRVQASHYSGKRCYKRERSRDLKRMETNWNQLQSREKEREKIVVLL